MVDDEIREAINWITENGRFDETKTFIQHGDRSVYDHCVAAAKMSVRIVDKLHIRVDRHSLIIGALLHDYFLYDWHDNSSKTHSWHGFTHPAAALRNAEEDFDLSKREEDIISHHMFPLVPMPPHSREAWIVCLADKIVASKETAKPYYFKLFKKA